LRGTSAKICGKCTGTRTPENGHPQNEERGKHRKTDIHNTSTGKRTSTKIRGERIRGERDPQNEERKSNAEIGRGNRARKSDIHLVAENGPPIVQPENGDLSIAETALTLTFLQPTLYQMNF
jgi:hypothetical protein